MELQILGAANEVTGSCHLLKVGEYRILLDCGLIQGSRQEEARNSAPFPFDPKTLDAVILSHAHIDHSGRLPLLVKQGFRGDIYTHKATADLCRIMLRDAAYLNEKDARLENRKRERKGLKRVEPLYTVQEAEAVFAHFQPLDYAERVEILPRVAVRLSDAGHILGSAIVELWLHSDKQDRKLVFSGDLGRSGMPVLEDPAMIKHADMVLMESTYGDRLHRRWEDTLAEMASLLQAVTAKQGNILIPAFSVGRTQEILYLFAKYYDEWGLSRWHIFLDSPMAIEATEVYARNCELFDDESSQLWREHRITPMLPNLRFTPTPEESMRINQIHSGAIIIAGSGMCNGGRIRHHLKHNAWRRDCHILISGFQARGTLGRALVDGAKHIRLWGETIRVAAQVHTIGGLSAHADQAGLSHWYAQFEHRPPVVLVHGEPTAKAALAAHLRHSLSAPVHLPTYGETLCL
ncbi:MBL fold metallo-hydrolase RNA specificity domain-containing protein [Thiothrix subterranea]|uniref:MBL fold metallo-hydrolase RNA specificity domain-containing protein n=1 Tax=Thiothrix subterranea TaxID=2735563 RepID=UPI0035ADD797